MNPVMKGILFSLVTVVMWGILPLMMQQVLPLMNSQTLIAYRFLFAALVLGLALRKSKRLPDFHLFTQSRTVILISIGIISLAANFWLFSTALYFIEPSASQVLGQLTPFVMLAVSVLFLKESFGKHQLIGAIVLFIGILLFFNQKVPTILAGQGGVQLKGVALVIMGASVWVAYGLVQKVLSAVFLPQQILFIIYTGCAIVLFPFANFEQALDFGVYEWCCLLFCCLNTPIAYGAFGEAVRCWEVSKVSTLLTLVPLVTILFSHVLHIIAPQLFAAPNLNVVAYVGACLVVFSAVFSIIGHKFCCKKNRLQQHK